MKDSDAKQAFKDFLMKNLGVEEGKIDCKKKYADVIVKTDNNSDKWLYFEIKSSDRTQNKNNYKFGAVFKSQWKESIRHAGYYYFVIVEKLSDSGNSENNFNFYILSPDELRRYVSGYNVLTYINIRNTELEKATKISKSNIKEVWNTLNKNKYKDSITYEATDHGQMAYEKMISICKQEIEEEEHQN